MNEEFSATPCCARGLIYTGVSYSVEVVVLPLPWLSLAPVVVVVENSNSTAPSQVNMKVVELVASVCLLLDLVLQLTGMYRLKKLNTIHIFSFSSIYMFLIII